MKQRYTWKEFENMALSFIGINSDEVKPRYIKTYSYEPEGDHYDFPDFIEIEVPSKKDKVPQSPSL